MTCNDLSTLMISLAALVTALAKLVRARRR